MDEDGRRHGRVPTWAPALLRAWIPVVALAELAGFALPAVVGVLTAGAPTTVSLPLLVAAGAVEGAVLGAGQMAVMRRVLPAVSAVRWVGATAVAAALAYLLALLPSAAAPVLATWPVPVVVVLVAVLAVLVLLVLGLAQWLELRRHVSRAATWIGVTALAWLLGLSVFLAVATPLWHPGQSAVVAVAIGLGAGALMAVAMAAVTGIGLVRLLARDPGHAGTLAVPFGPGDDGTPPRGSPG
ncbi:hypothetical protein PHK61_14325 [Actinomycetospora lutea]|uniref:hypothetical protein n=1 Tax=Actinomycetospora lutea TaxID=663604 RepID=UPI002366C3F4|nr:hypothetical protein [Actinomycetospora lutea]MDD7939596.1 hypothetical protein [Actinomycetospora lutea]